MMHHLSDEQLNEILDNRAEHFAIQHTETCADCRTRLEELRSIFAMFESLPETECQHDLTASILTRLPQRRVSPAWKWLFAAQFFGALAIAASMANSFALPAEVVTYQPPTLDSLLASVLASLASVSFKLPVLDFQSFSIDLQSTTILLFVISATVLWLVGNSLLLRGTVRRSR